MIKNRGVIDEVINGKRITFKWDMQAFENLGDMLNQGLSGTFVMLGQGRLSALASFLYVGAVRYCRVNKKDIDFTREDASDWLAALGLEKVMTHATDCIDSPKYEEKNESTTVNKSGALQTI